ncbi:hypothetical protein D5086_006361 [Populus alba]|uniref:Uncharacterized protein n=1 Tax=Populus alba TaxID=43335 RepID=A0ACC4CMI9_POPAL
MQCTSGESSGNRENSMPSLSLLGLEEEFRCPYISRELHKVVDLLFAPYNYLIYRGNKKSLTIEWDNNRLIFDEALLLKLEKLIAEVPFESKELGFTKPGS